MRGGVTTSVGQPAPAMDLVASDEEKVFCADMASSSVTALTPCAQVLVIFNQFDCDGDNHLDKDEYWAFLQVCVPSAWGNPA